MPVSEEELAGARAAWADYMPDTFQRETYVLTPDGAGGTTSEPTLGAAVACRVAPLGAGASSSPEAVLAGRLGLDFGWVLTMPVGTALTEEDVVVVNGTRRLQVAAVLAPRSYDMATRVLCQEVK